MIYPRQCRVSQQRRDCRHRVVATAPPPPPASVPPWQEGGKITADHHAHLPTLVEGGQEDLQPWRKAPAVATENEVDAHRNGSELPFEACFPRTRVAEISE